MSEPTHKSKSEQRTLVTDQSRANYAETFGHDGPAPGSRGRWVWDAKQNRLVRAEEYVPEHRDERQPLYTDRHHEGTVATDGTDIGSRAKRREYMKRNGLAEADDFKGVWAKTEAQKAEANRLGGDPRQLRDLAEQVGRTAYELGSKKRNGRR